MAKIVYVVRIVNRDPAAYSANVDGHRAWIDKHADASFVLCGPFEDRSLGGLIIAQAESRATLDRILAEDPLVQCGAAVHDVTPLEISRGYLAQAIR